MQMWLAHSEITVCKFIPLTYKIFPAFNINLAISIFWLRKFAVLEVAREDEFSPLKNGKGSPTDSPDTALRDLLNLHYNYIVKAGGKFEDSAE